MITIYNYNTRNDSSNSTTPEFFDNVLLVGHVYVDIRRRRHGQHKMTDGAHVVEPHREVFVSVHKDGLRHIEYHLGNVAHEENAVKEEGDLGHLGVAFALALLVLELNGVRGDDGVQPVLSLAVVPENFGVKDDDGAEGKDQVEEEVAPDEIQLDVDGADAHRGGVNVPFGFVASRFLGVDLVKFSRRNG